MHVELRRIAPRNVPGPRVGVVPVVPLVAAVALARVAMAGHRPMEEIQKVSNTSTNAAMMTCYMYFLKFVLGSRRTRCGGAFDESVRRLW